MKKLPNVKEHKEIISKMGKIPVFRDKVLFELIYFCGLRVSEALSLRKRDINLKKRILKVVCGKGNKDRLIPFPKTLLTDLEPYLKIVTDELFKIGRTRAYQLSKKYFNLSPHGLRHSYATHILERTGNLELVRDLLGHTDIRTTKIYTHMATDSKKKLIDEVF